MLGFSQDKFGSGPNLLFGVAYFEGVANLLNFGAGLQKISTGEIFYF